MITHHEAERSLTVNIRESNRSNTSINTGPQNPDNHHHHPNTSQNTVLAYVDAYFLGRKFHVKVNIPQSSLSSNGEDGNLSLVQDEIIKTALFEKIRNEIWSDMAQTCKIKYAHDNDPCSSSSSFVCTETMENSNEGTFAHNHEDSREPFEDDEGENIRDTSSSCPFSKSKTITRKSVSVSYHWDPSVCDMTSAQKLDYFEPLEKIREDISTKTAGCPFSKDSSHHSRGLSHGNSNDSCPMSKYAPAPTEEEIMKNNELIGFISVQSMMSEETEELVVPIENKVLRMKSTNSRPPPSILNRPLILLDALRRCHNSILISDGWDRERCRNEFNSLLDSLLDLMNSQFGFIAETLEDKFFDPKTNTVEIRPYMRSIALTDITRAADGKSKLTSEHFKTGIEFRNLNTLWGFSLTSKKGVISNNPEKDPRSSGVPAWHPKLTAFMSLPLFFGDKMIGMVGLANKPGGYTMEDVAFLLPFLGSCAHFIESYRSHVKRRQAEEALRNEVLEKTALSERLEVAKAISEKSAQVKAQFLACMSHEIRTPMHGILGMMDLLKETQLNDEQLEYVESMKKCSKNLMTIINDILDFSRLESGKLAITEAPMHLVNVMESVMDMATLGWDDEKKLVLYYDLVSTMPGHIITDETRFKQILHNLIHNSAKFSPDGGYIFVKGYKFQTEQDLLKLVQADKIKVPSEKLFINHLKTKKHLFNEDGERKGLEHSNQERLFFLVADEGIGIEANSIQKLFSIFVQADTTTTRRFGGSGLGLAICRQLCNLLGGEIGVVSESGVGSVFYFTIPLTEPSKTQIEEYSHAYLAGQSSLSMTNQMISIHHQSEQQQTMLLLFKKPFFVDICKTMLERSGYRIVAFADNKENTVHENLKDLQNFLDDLVMKGVRIDYTYVHLNKKDLNNHLTSTCAMLNLFRLYNSMIFNSQILPYGMLREKDIVETMPSISEELAKSLARNMSYHLRKGSITRIVTEASQMPLATDFTFDLVATVNLNMLYGYPVPDLSKLAEKYPFVPMNDMGSSCVVGYHGTKSLLVSHKNCPVNNNDCYEYDGHAESSVIVTVASPLTHILDDFSKSVSYGNFGADRDDSYSGMMTEVMSIHSSSLTETQSSTPSTLESGFALNKESARSLADDTNTLAKKRRFNESSSGTITVEKTNIHRNVTDENEENKNNEKKINLNDRYVLVAEDNVVNQTLLKKMLGKLKYKAKFVNNGKEAIDAILENPHLFDIVLMDLHMPEMDGIEATKILKKLFFEKKEQFGANPPRIIAITANAMHGAKEECLGVGFNDYVTKPVGIQLLSNKIEEWRRK